MTQDSWGVPGLSIRVELEGMKFQIVNAVMQHNKEMAEILDRTITDVIRNFDYEAIIRNVAHKAIQEALEKAVKSYFEWGDGQKFMKTLAAAALTKITNEPASS